MIHEKAITLKQLRALAAIVRGGNLSAAADLLNVTGPAVSTQLKLLEANFDASLLRRGPDGRVRLNAEGETVLATIDQIENTLELCFKRVNALRSGKMGHVALGVVSTGKYIAPGLVAQMRKAWPEIEIALEIGNREEIIDALRSCRIDLAVMGRPPREPVVEAEILGPHPHILIAPPDHPLVTACDITPDALLGETFLCREPGSGTRILTERYLDRIGEGLTWDRIDLASNETIKQAVIAGLGIALISAHTVIAELETGRLATIPMEGLPIIRQWFLVHRAGEALTPASRQLHDQILDFGGSFLPGLDGRN